MNTDTKRLYSSSVGVWLQPVIDQTPVDVRVSFAGEQHEIGLLRPQWVTFTRDLPAGNYKLIVEFYNKQLLDSLKPIDKAVIIQSLSVNNIVDNNFVYQGVYKPDYPEPWASEQRSNNIELKPVLNNQTYLGWNGTWELDLEVPLFTWAHKAKGLGWIYD